MPSIPFSSNSGSVDVDCDQWGSTSAQFVAPDGARIAEHHAAWQNLANIKESNISVNVSPDGKTFTATGGIRGLDARYIFGMRECPGGGHGTLVISGTYTM